MLKEKGITKIVIPFFIFSIMLKRSSTINQYIFFLEVEKQAAI